MEIATSPYRTAFEKQINSINGSMNDKLRQKKKDAFNDFEAIGLPGKKFETWKYSNIAAWTKNEYLPIQLPLKSKKAQIPVQELSDANLIVFNNGNFDPEASDIKEKGIEVSSIREKLQSSDANQFSDQFIDAIENREKEPLHFLNTAFFENGLFVNISKGKLIEQPLVILHQFDNVPDKTMLQNRIIFNVEENAQIKCAEFFNANDAPAFLYNSLEEIYVGPQARVEWNKLENTSNPAIHVQSQKVKQEERSYFKSWSFIDNPEKLRNNTYVQLNGTFSESEIFGLSLQNGKSHADNHILIDHAVEDCQSNQLFKGTYDDRSTAVFNGKVLVRKDAQRTNAFQSNKNLLLSDKATINSKPELEIYADDVKCSHGATTGQMNENELFYLQARGIEKDKAKAILNQAFLAELIDYVTIPDLKNYFHDYLEKSFDNA